MNGCRKIAHSTTFCLGWSQTDSLLLAHATGGSTSVRHRKLQSSTVNNFLSAFGKSGERATPPSSAMTPPLKWRRGLSVTEWGESHPTVICDDTSPQWEARVVRYGVDGEWILLLQVLSLIHI